MTLADAFRRHADARAAIENGEDPQSAKTEARTQKKSALTVDELIAAFAAKHLARKRTSRDGKRRLEKISFAFGWGDRDAASITDEEAHDCLTKLAGREYRNERGRVIGGKVEAFACKSLLGSMWRWGKRAKLLRTNIFRDLDVDAARKPRRRNRVLTPDEIRTLWTELDQPQAFGFTADAATALRLILTTAARPGMVTGMLRERIDRPRCAGPAPGVVGPIARGVR